MLLFISDAHMQVRELYKTSISRSPVLDRGGKRNQLMQNLDGNILAWCHPLGQKQEKHSRMVLEGGGPKKLVEQVKLGRRHQVSKRDHKTMTQHCCRYVFMYSSCFNESGRRKQDTKRLDKNCLAHSVTHLQTEVDGGEANRVSKTMTYSTLCFHVQQNFISCVY